MMVVILIYICLHKATEEVEVTFSKFYGNHHELVEPKIIAKIDMFQLSKPQASLNF